MQGVRKKNMLLQAWKTTSKNLCNDTAVFVVVDAMHYITSFSRKGTNVRDGLHSYHGYVNFPVQHVMCISYMGVQ